MTNVSEWSVTAGSNNASPPDGWPEGMARSAVNDAAREMMASLAQWYQDSNGTLVTATSTTAYTLATNSVHTAFNDIPLLVFRAHAANTGTVTLNVDGLGAKPWRKDAGLTDYASGEIALGQLLVVGYNSVEDDFFTVGPVSDSAVPTGTVMLFQQTAAPTGWTKGATHNDKALRVVTGTASSGGTTAFTSVLASRTIATANLPAHTHAAGTLAADSGGAHTHSFTAVRTINSATVNATGTKNEPDAPNTGATTSDGAHTHTISGATGSIGSGTAMDFAVQYVDVILATRN